MKNYILVASLLLISVCASAQLQTFKGDTTGTVQASRINIGANSSGRPGFKGNVGNFQPFATLAEVATATGGSVSTVNGKSGPAVSLTTADINEATNLYYTVTRARQAISATGPIVYNSGTGALTFSGTRSDVGLGNVDNTTDATKPVSTPQQTALNAKSDLASSVYRANVATFAALNSYTVPSGQTYLIRVAADESQTTPYNVNQWYMKDDSGSTFKIALIKQ